MPKFSAKSESRLLTCVPDLQRLFRVVVIHYDCSILCGHRAEDEQNEAFESNNSHVMWPDSLHNQFPSKAVDVAPYPIDWDDLDRFYHFGGFVRGIATMMQIPIRGGHDWDSDTILDDQKFMDLPHFEKL